jgi:RNA polymerase sigma-70 factor, ECF subfamily
MTKKTIISQRPNKRSAEVIPLHTGDHQAPVDANAEDDAQLLERVAQQDHTAFAILVRRHTMRFFRVAYRYLRNASEAEDTVQDAFVKLWERPSMWQAGRNTAFTTWFYRIIVNQCLDFAKKKRPLALLDDAWIEDDRESHEELLIQDERQRLLEQQIAKLPERQRTALNLCFYENLSNQQAADIMGVRLKALQALLMRAKNTLKEQLKFMTGGTSHV